LTFVVLDEFVGFTFFAVQFISAIHAPSHTIITFVVDVREGSSRASHNASQLVEETVFRTLFAVVRVVFVA
jgi:hypothetical protein